VNLICLIPDIANTDEQETNTASRSTSPELQAALQTYRTYYLSDGIQKEVDDEAKHLSDTV
jgi:hypothetical protein